MAKISILSQEYRDAVNEEMNRISSSGINRPQGALHFNQIVKIIHLPNYVYYIADKIQKKVTRIRFSGQGKVVKHKRGYVRCFIFYQFCDGKGGSGVHPLISLNLIDSKNNEKAYLFSNKKDADMYAKGKHTIIMTMMSRKISFDFLS